MKKMNKRLYLVTAAVALSLLFAGCGGSGNTGDSGSQPVRSASQQLCLGASSGNSDMKTAGAGDSADSANVNADSGEAATVTATEAAGDSSSKNTGRKLIRTVGIVAETEKYDALVTKVSSQTTALGGYIESSSENAADYDGNGDSGRTISMVLRIPKDNADKLIKTVDGEANIVSRTENSDDVTLQYTDIASHKKALQAEEQRLTELMEKADNMTDIVAIEDKLADVRYQIESMESQLRVYDNQVDYTTINLDISEVKTYSETGEESFGQRVTSGFMKSLKGVGHGAVEFAVWFISHIPYLVIWILIIFAVIRVCISVNKKNKASRVYVPQAPGVNTDMKKKKKFFAGKNDNKAQPPVNGSTQEVAGNAGKPDERK